jgi:sensor histidine kinase regulating citrate/malate metabolism
VVEASDSGPGVLVLERDTVFVDSFTTKKAGAGPRRGPGLAMARQVIGRYPGNIVVSQEVGAYFRITLPGIFELDLKETATNVHNRERNTAPVPRVIVVDDDS